MGSKKSRQETQASRSKGQAAQETEKKKKARKLLRQRRRFRKGIPICVRDGWVTDDDFTNCGFRDAQFSVPWLLSSISSDGLQVKVVLATIVNKVHSDEASDTDDAARPCKVKDSLPPGVAELVRKGYSMNGLFDPELNTKGLFKDVDAVPISDDFEDRYHLIGVDPGQINVPTMVRQEAMLSRGTRQTLINLHKSTEGEETSRCFTAQRYRYESLARFSEKWESRRRTGEYKGALDSFSQVSLKKAGECGSYAKVVYDTLPAMASELLSNGRRRLRFKRFRAQTRSVHEMAKAVAYGAEQEQLHATAKRRFTQTLFAKKRVVFFGLAQFGHGRSGPCPRKKLLRALSLLFPVVLVDEWCTSKCCKNCGSVLKTTYGSRVLRCDNNQAGAGSCSVDEIDRDTNASANIGTCVIHMLLDMQRPPRLRRPNRS